MWTTFVVSATILALTSLTYLKVIKSSNRSALRSFGITLGIVAIGSIAFAWTAYHYSIFVLSEALMLTVVGLVCTYQLLQVIPTYQEIEP